MYATSNKIWKISKQIQCIMYLLKILVIITLFTFQVCNDTSLRGLFEKSRLNRTQFLTYGTQKTHRAGQHQNICSCIHGQSETKFTLVELMIKRFIIYGNRTG